MKIEPKQKGIKLIETSVTVSSSLNLGRKKQLKLQEEEEGKQEEEEEPGGKETAQEGCFAPQGVAPLHLLID